MKSWLVLSGQRWKLRSGTACTWLGLALLCAQFVVRGRGAVVVPCVLGAFILLTAGFVFPLLIQCRVCGLQLLTSKLALQLPLAVRTIWLSKLEECPMCDDDGSATGDVRRTWSLSGRKRESPYWSSRRVIIAMVLAATFLVGGVAVAQLRIKAWVQAQQAATQRTSEMPGAR